jgi:hypothetical protein
MPAQSHQFYLVRISSDTKRGAIEQNSRPSFFLITIASFIREKALGNYVLVDTRFITPQPEQLPHFDIFIIEADQHHLNETKDFFEQAIRSNPNARLFFIGQGPTAVPMFFLQLTENGSKGYIVRGEPEEIILETLETNTPPSEFDSKKIYQAKGFHHFPAMNFTTEQLQNYQYIFPIKMNKKISWGHVLATRGCPHTCSFCTNMIRESYGVNFRTKNITTLIKELNHLKHQGVNVVAFADDDLTADAVFLENLCDEMISCDLQLHWSAHARIDECNPKLLKKMKKAGCSLLRFGIESGSEKTLKYFNKTKAPKDWFEQTKTIINSCKKEDIQTVGLFIIGAPGEQWSDIKQTLNLIFETPFNLIQLHIFTPFQDTVESRKLKVSNVVQNSYYNPNAGEFSPLGKAKIRFIYMGVYIGFYLHPLRLISTVRNYGEFFIKNYKIFLVLVTSLFKVCSLSLLGNKSET